MPARDVLSPSSWAQAHGISAVSATAAVRAGKIAVDADGHVIPEHPATLAWVESARRTPRHAGGVRKKKYTAVNIPESPVAARPVDTSGGDTPRGIMGMDRSEVEKIKLVSQIKQIEQKTQIQRGDFVARDLTRRVLAQYYALDQSEFVPLASKMATEAASIFGSDDSAKIQRLREYGETECWKIIAHCKRLFNDFLDSVDAEPL